MIRWTTVHLLCGVFAFLSTRSDLRAQETAAETEHKPQNTVTISIGRSRGEIENSVEEIIRAIGSDYMRQIGGKWEAGVQVDVDLDRDGSGAEAFLVTPVVAYNITERWPVFVGVGVAFEKEHTIGFARLGSEFMFPLDRESRWFVAPGVFLDIAGEATPSVMLALGHTF
jgi:hypothetical protein